ncbi:cupin domain-containing protein [Sciscionella sediminilitoris]|uniref:cupin domain-containing protein n=1 Tax=Sciscionella sediminilitoris TaxID=1445613 RepID=UPI000691D8E8|nr:cupin domain-containing protein [Sciscionella sp. SE31]
MTESTSTRRVVTGHDESGHSTVVADERVPVGQDTAICAITDLLRLAELPAASGDVTLRMSGARIEPPPRGLAAKLIRFPPDEHWLGSGGEQVRAAFAAVDGAELHAEDEEIPGMHATSTVDFAVVIDGELTVLLENTETTLRPGETLVQLATKHAWRNRTDRHATALFVMCSANEANETDEANKVDRTEENGGTP